MSFCQQYVRNNTKEIQKKIEQLEQEMKRLNSSISESAGTSADLLE